MGAGHTADQDQIARKTEQLCNSVYYGSGGSERAEVAPWQKAVPEMGKSHREGGRALLDDKGVRRIVHWKERNLLCC